MSAALVTDHDQCGSVMVAPAVGIHDRRKLVRELLASRSVEIVPRRGSHVLVAPRRPDEPAASWLGRVLRVIVPQLDDAAERSELVLEAVAQVTGRPVRLLSRPRTAIEPMLDRVETGRFLVADADCVWVVHGLTRDVNVDPLLATLAITVCADEPRQDESAVVCELSRAVAAADADAFVRTVAEACGGTVRLRLASGDIVSEATTGRGSLAQDFVVRFGHAIRGSVEIRRATSRPDAETLTTLAGALLGVIGAGSDREELENEVAVLRCLLELGGPAPARAGVEARRLVLVSTAPGTTYWGVRTLCGKIRAFASQIPELESLAIAATPDQRLIGVYAPRPGDGVEVQRRAWDRLLDGVDPAGAVRALISTPVRSGEEIRRSLGALERLAEWCSHDDSARAARSTVADQVGPLWSSLGVWPVDGVRPYIDSVLGSLVDDDRFGGELTDTLYAYLQGNGSLRAAAERLHLHASTVKYRMRILRGLLGDRLTDPDQRFELELALRLHLARRTAEK